MGKKVAILAGGEIADYQAVKTLTEDAILICADSGYRHSLRLGRTPDLLVGDFDSIQEIPPDIPTIQLSVDKNYTDSVYAVKQAERYQPDQLLLLGMLGGRLDHSLANLALLVRCTEAGYSTLLTDGITEVQALVGEKGGSCFSFPPKENHYFSVFSYSDFCRQVRIVGGKYPLDNYDLTNRDARAVSNEFLTIPLTIALQSGILLLVTTPK